MINFNWVEWSNFLSNGATPSRMYLNEHKTTLIRGTNGAGKTTIIEALLYGLFNKPLRKVKLPQLVNTVNKKKMYVKVNFTINGVTYEVHRGQKPRLFKLFSDHSGEMEELDSTNDLQHTLENDILNTNYKTFLQVVVMASMKYTNFMDLDAAGRRVVVNQMLDLEILTVMTKLLSDRVKEVKRKSSSIESNHNELHIKIQGVQRLIESASKSNSGQIEELDKLINDADNKWTGLDVEMDNLRTENDSHQETKPNIDSGEINSKINNLNTQISNLKSEVKLAEHEYNTHFATAKFYASNDRCDRCAQDINVDFKRNILLELKDKCDLRTNAITDHKNVMSEYHCKVDELQKSLQELHVWDQRSAELIGKAQQIQHEMSMLVQQKQQYINQKTTLLQSSNDDVSGYTKELDELNAELESVVSKRAEISEEMELCSLCAQMLNDKGLKAKIIKEYLPVINSTLNHYLDIMGANYSFVLDEQFNETLLSRYRDDFSYGSFSNGEATRINFAIVFMFRKIASLKNTVSTNLLFLDEVLDSSMDKQGIDDLMAIIKTMEKSNVLVISHREELVDMFDRVVTANKIGNFASYDL